MSHALVLAAILERPIWSLARADVELARAGDLLLGVDEPSSHCASHPAVRGIANRTGNIAVGSPSAW